jgi:aspartate racemase
LRGKNVIEGIFMKDDPKQANGLPENRRYGLVDGPAADSFFERLVAVLAAKFGEKPPEILFPRFSGDGKTLAPPGVDPRIALKIQTFDAVRKLEEFGVDAVLLPCFSSQEFIEEIEAETSVPIVRPMDSLRAELSRRHPAGGRIGILCADRRHEEAFFERCFFRSHSHSCSCSPRENWLPLYPADAIDGADESASALAERLSAACADLAWQGAESILAGDASAASLAPALRARGFPLVDPFEVYAGYVAALPPGGKRKPFRIGVAGGVGPAATVDFLDKIVRNTSARCDQEHIKVIVEQNPQIPDRTAHLTGDGVDPTIALYATCKRLEDAGASILAIPCNTAHAFVGRIQPFLSIPIINMLIETAGYIRENHGESPKIGLLATSGTIASRVYHEAFASAGLEILVPDAENQERVMRAIYGPKGVKAGFTEGECLDDLLLALSSLARRGANAIVLGCTELPLLLAQNEAFPVAGKTVAVLDPTDILARKCVGLGRKAATEKR